MSDRATNVRLAREAARRHGLREGLFIRQMRQEANFTDQRSPAGAQGPAQIMPATAASWKVDPHNAAASYDAAARHMKAYVDKYGEEGALRAYNAGEGAVEKSKGYAETNNYVKTILGGLGSAKPSARKAATSTAKSMLIPGATSQNTDAAVMDILAAHKPGSKLKQLDAALGSGAYDTTTAEHTVKVPGSKQPGSTGPGPKHRSTLLELFWQGQGGINVKNGAKVAQGFVDGHTDHVHVAAGPKTVRELGRLAQSMGLKVGENSHFNGGKRVTAGHAADSYHYRDQAIDVSGDAQAMAHYAATVAHQYGVKVNG